VRHQRQELILELGFSLRCSARAPFLLEHLTQLRSRVIRTERALFLPLAHTPYRCGFDAKYRARRRPVPPGSQRYVPSSRERAAAAGRRLALALKAFVVEDNVSIRDSLIEALLELTGITTCGVAASEKGAVAWLTDPANEWDLAIVDLILEPGGSGLGVLHACRDRKPGRKVVVLTGTANPEVRRQCEALGSDRVFDKSIETDALMDWCLALAQAAPR
jgi:CheY-like chemotaxis protein